LLLKSLKTLLKGIFLFKQEHYVFAVNNQHQTLSAWTKSLTADKHF